MVVFMISWFIDIAGRRWQDGNSQSQSHTHPASVPSALRAPPMRAPDVPHPCLCRRISIEARGPMLCRCRGCVREFRVLQIVGALALPPSPAPHPPSKQHLVDRARRRLGLDVDAAHDQPEPISHLSSHQSTSTTARASLVPPSPAARSVFIHQHVPSRATTASFSS